MSMRLPQYNHGIQIGSWERDCKPHSPEELYSGCVSESCLPTLDCRICKSVDLQQQELKLVPPNEVQCEQGGLEKNETCKGHRAKPWESQNWLWLSQFLCQGLFCLEVGRWEFYRLSRYSGHYDVQNRGFFNGVSYLPNDFLLIKLTTRLGTDIHLTAPTREAESGGKG